MCIRDRLHMEIVRERLEREYRLDLVATAPSVAYRVHLTDHTVVEIRSPADLPDVGLIDHLDEPLIKALVVVPTEYVGTVMELAQSRRGTMQHMHYLTPERVELTYAIPLAEVVFDFFDALKSRTRGYGSLDYEPAGYAAAALVKVDILLNGQQVDAFSAIVHKDKGYDYGRRMVARLRTLIPPVSYTHLRAHETVLDLVC